MNRPTEYAVMKRLLFARKDLDPDLNGHEVNAMIQDACTDALAKLDFDDRTIVLSQAAKLETHCRWLSEKGSLEVLAAVADYMPEPADA